MKQHLTHVLTHVSKVLENRLNEAEAKLEKAMELIADLTAKVEQLTRENKRLRLENEALKLENKTLRQQNQELIRRVFGSSSERHDPNQLNLLELEEAKKPVAADLPEESAPAANSKKRSKQQKLKKSMEDLPTTSETIEPEGISDSPDDWKRIGEDITEELHYQPARYTRHRIIRPRYARREESIEEANIAQAALPPRLLANSVLTPSLLAGVITNKYCWHLPLNRQEQLMRTAGLICSRSLLASWMGVAAQKLKPLYKRLKQKLIAGNYLQIDETPIAYLDPGKGSTKQGYLWAIQHPLLGVYYEWHTGRAHKHLLKLMDEPQKFHGILQHDAYQPYLTYAEAHGLEHVACMAHIRRYFEKALKAYPALAGWFMRQFARLYQIEQELRDWGATAEQRTRRRQIHSRPILKLLKKAVLHLSQSPKILPRDHLGKALTYARGQLPHMDTWLDHGQVEIDNNLVENSMRPTKLGMKNWLFFGSADSGENSAILYTLVQNVRRLNRDPFVYLEWLFEKLRLDPSPADLDVLLPTAWAAAHPELQPLRDPKTLPPKAKAA